MTSGHKMCMPSPGTMPNSKCGLSWNKVCGRRQDDVGQKRVFAVQQHRAVQGRDHRHLDVEDVGEHLTAFAQDLVVALGREEVEALGVDRIHEGVARTRQDHHAIVAILADGVEQVDELLVCVAVEDQLPAAAVQRDFEHAVGLAGEAGIGERIAISVEMGHGCRPCTGRRRSVGVGTR